jgi:hypothetical protein
VLEAARQEAAQTLAPDLVPAALPLAEVRATMRALRSYLPELYPTARELMAVGIDHIEAACDQMEGG